MKKMLTIVAFLSILLIGCNQDPKAILISPPQLTVIGNTPFSSLLTVTNVPASSAPKETTPAMQNQSQLIKMDKNFDIKKLRLLSVKLSGKSDIWAWGYDISQRGRLTLLSTGDSGETWDQVTGLSDEAPGMFPDGSGGLPFEELAAGAFLDANTGWLAWVKDGRMTTEWIHDNKTTLNTMQTAVPASATVVQSLNFINSKEGFALLIGKSNANEEQKFLLQTKDAGQNWSQVSSNVPGQFLSEDKAVNLAMSAYGNGWIGIDVSQTDALPTLYHTTNEGMSWSRIRLPIGSGTQAPPQITGISTPIMDGKGNVTIVAALTGEAIKSQITYHSRDNGASWDPVVDVKFNVPETVNIPLFNYVSSTIGYAVSGFDLFRTSDGGRSWRIVSDDSLKKLASNYVGPISEIHFENEERGYVTLEGNDYSRMVLFSSNGGQTWTKLN